MTDTMGATERGGEMHDQPEPTEEEHELAVTPRQSDEESKGGAGHDDPPDLEERDEE